MHKDICFLCVGRALQGLAEANLQTLAPNLSSIGLPPCFLHSMETWNFDVKVSLWLVPWGCLRALYEMCNRLLLLLNFAHVSGVPMCCCRPVDRTLFIITHSATDEEYTDNLRFLLKHGMGGQDDGLREYIIIVQQAWPPAAPSPCPCAVHTQFCHE